MYVCVWERDKVSLCLYSIWQSLSSNPWEHLLRNGITLLGAESVQLGGLKKDLDVRVKKLSHENENAGDC